jgi:hypothetical protein
MKTRRWLAPPDSHAIRGKDRAAAQVWDDLVQQARGESKMKLWRK